MATSAFLPVSIRASRQCSQLLGGSARATLSLGLSAGLGRGFRQYGIQRSIVTLTGCPTPFKNRYVLFEVEGDVWLTIPEYSGYIHGCKYLTNRRDGLRIRDQRNQKSSRLRRTSNYILNYTGC